MAYSYDYGTGSGKTNQRMAPRVATPPVAVKVKGECQRLYGYVRDLSQNGMQLRTFMFCSSEPKKEGEQIHIEFELPETGKNFECDARVVWNMIPEDGPRTLNLQGVEFVGMDEPSRMALNEWVKNEGLHMY